MSKKLTDISVRNLRPRDKAFSVPDGGSGLYCTVQPSAHKSWAVMYRVNGKQAKLGLGSFPPVTLAEARKAAIDARESAAKGIDPSEARREKKIEADAAKADTVTAVCEQCLDKLAAKGLRSAPHQRSMLKRLVYPALGSMPVKEIKRSNITRLLDKIESVNGQRTADMVLSILNRSFNWFALRDDDFVNPIVRGMSPYKYKEHKGDRTLTDDEIRAVWKATEDGSPFSALVRFLLLTSARRNEAAGLRPTTEIKNGVWTLPASRSKTKTDVTRPLSKAALALLEARPKIEDLPWAFSSTGLGPLASFSEPMAKLREQSGVTNWRLHDLRRTARSLLSRAGISADLAERCLGHAKQGMRGVYDHHDFVPEMTHAFEALASQIERIVNPPEGDVIDMQARRR